MRKRIQDKFTDLAITRQRKYQLRHPQLHKDAERRYRQLAAGKQVRSEINWCYSYANI